MRTVGIIAEYNPLHNGHLCHLREARRLSGADLVVVVMSTAFTQRGEPALFSMDDRVRMALAAGADAVFALPALWAVRDAEHFALGGVSLLQRLGCDAISFGAECTDPGLLAETAALLESDSPGLRTALQPYLAQGLPWPQAISRAAEELLPGAGALLASPNNTLGICYLRAMLRLDAPMAPVVVRRQGSYHSGELAEGALPSATAVRAALRSGQTERALEAVPACCRPILQSGRQAAPDGLDQALLYRLRSMTEAEYAALPGLSEGIENRLRQAAERAVNREELLALADTRRYPAARLSRLCAHALLRLEESALRDAPLPELWLLGMRPTAAPLLKQVQEKGTRVLSRSGEMDPNALWVKTELLAHSLWCLAAGCPAESLLQRKFIYFSSSSSA